MSLDGAFRRPPSGFFGRLAESFSQAKSCGFLLVLASLPPLLWVLAAIPEVPDTRSLIYKFSIPGYYAFLVFVPCLLAGFLFPRGLRKLYLALLGTLWLSFLVADIFVFDAYKFHINLFLLQFFFTNFAEMGVTPLLAALGLAALGLCAGAAWSLASWAMDNPRWLKGFATLGLVLTLLAFTVNQVLYVWGENYKRNEITAYGAYLPAFLPTTSQKNAPKLAKLFPEWLPAEHGAASATDQKLLSKVNYPLAMPGDCKANPSENILFIVLESWQADALSAEVTPNLAALAANSWQFKRHVSGGNGTVHGLFSAMFGLHGAYYDAFRANPAANPSLLTELVRQREYQTRVFTSGNLDRFALRALFFPKVSESHYHFVDGKGHEGQGDALVIEALENSIRTATEKQPRFDFVYLMASHFPYQYPPTFAKFTPLPEREGEHLLNKNIDPVPVKNDYRNSLYFLDQQLGKLFDTMKRQGSFDKTWIVLIGDHGEEFNENGLGHWGHGANFGRWQTQTPLIVKRAHQKTGQISDQLSTHQDIVPTLIEEALGCKAPTLQYSNGLNLFKPQPPRGTVFYSYAASAYLVDDTIVEKYSLDPPYAWSDVTRRKDPPSPAAIKALVEAEARFMR